jgi:hypothetical protein
MADDMPAFASGLGDAAVADFNATVALISRS